MEERILTACSHPDGVRSGATKTRSGKEVLTGYKLPKLPVKVCFKAFYEFYSYNIVKNRDEIFGVPLLANYVVPLHPEN